MKPHYWKYTKICKHISQRDIFTRLSITKLVRCYI